MKPPTSYGWAKGSGIAPYEDTLQDEGALVGVLDIPAEKVVKKGRLEPGRMLWIDTEEGRIVSDERG